MKKSFITSDSGQLILFFAYGQNNSIIHVICSFILKLLGQNLTSMISVVNASIAEKRIFIGWLDTIKYFGILQTNF